MAYAVKEIFYSLQGEGAQVGRPAVFCRFAGCNLWSGLERDRNDAVCKFCDTDFVGTDGPDGGVFETAQALAEAVLNRWPKSAAATGSSGSRPLVICTGGEPLLQLDQAAIAALHARGLEVAVETNGTRAVLDGIDWLCVSPKANTELLVRSGDELKLVYPQAGAEPELYADLGFRHFFLQPMDGSELAENTRLAVAYCLTHPRWRLSLQTHKLLGLR
ncbi:MAG: 7-carboxy-7-deazaguanine synthase [Pirellulaceae bacterium]